MSDLNNKDLHAIEEKKDTNKSSRVRKFQMIVYSLGLILAVASFIEFYYGNTIQSQIGDQEKALEELEAKRGAIMNIEHQYLDIWYGLLKTDIYIDLAMKESLITSEEAEALILKHVFDIYQVWYIFASDFIDIRYYYDNEWLFTEGIFILYYNYYEDYRAYLNGLFFFSDIYPSHEVLENWTIQTVSEENYTYSETYDILIFQIADRPMLLRVDLVKFDNYVYNNYQQPLNEARNILIALQVSASANTFGLLILGFIVNFEDVSKKFKVIYILLSTFSVVSSGLITYLYFVFPLLN